MKTSSEFMLTEGLREQVHCTATSTTTSHNPLHSPSSTKNRELCSTLIPENEAVDEKPTPYRTSLLTKEALTYRDCYVPLQEPRKQHTRLMRDQQSSTALEIPLAAFNPSCTAIIKPVNNREVLVVSTGSSAGKTWLAVWTAALDTNSFPRSSSSYLKPPKA